MIRYVFFDLGLTLIRNNLPQNIHEVLDCHDLSLYDVHMAYHLTNKLFMREHKGTVSLVDPKYFELYLNSMFSELKIKEDAKKIMERLRAEKKVTWERYPFVDEMFAELLEMGIKVGVISNWDRACRDIIKSTGVHEYLSHIYVSSEVGSSKPDSKMFELALEDTGLMPSECLYVGDNYYDDYEGASKVGMDTLIINPFGKMGIEELDYENIIENASEVIKYIREKNCL